MVCVKILHNISEWCATRYTLISGWCAPRSLDGVLLGTCISQDGGAPRHKLIFLDAVNQDTHTSLEGEHTHISLDVAQQHTQNSGWSAPR